MLNEDKTKLSIFENFIVDKDLPKHKNQSEEITLEFGTTPTPTAMEGWDSNATSNPASSNQIYIGEENALSIHGRPVLDSKGRYIKNNLWGRLKYVFREYKAEKRRKANSPKTQIPTLTVEDFFKSIKNDSKELAKIEKRSENYIKAIKEAKQFGQIALFEKLENMLKVVRQETQLYALGLKQIITEEQVVAFYKESEKGIRLDWIKNFTRPIPNNFLKIKKKIDDIGIFDNYAIMHYDPDTKSFSETIEEKKEKERKKRDPILFGLIKDSRKLYFIGDWKDEYCDLTLEEFIDKFGKKEMNKNNLTATIKIDKN